MSKNLSNNLSIIYIFWQWKRISKESIVRKKKIDIFEIIHLSLTYIGIRNLIVDYIIYRKKQLDKLFAFVYVWDILCSGSRERKSKKLSLLQPEERRRKKK